MKQRILDGLTDILEAPEPVTPETVLGASGAPWDSMSIVCVVGLLDDMGREVSGVELCKCLTAEDVLRLAGADA